MDAINKRETLVINLFAGPGAGKTTCAWEIAEKLKKLGYVTEYVSEYAKELVWDGREDLLDGSLKHQSMIYAEQKHRIDRLVGKVDFIVTDSPILLSITYLKEKVAAFEKQVTKDFNSYHNFCVFVERGSRYEKEGRLQTEDESKELDYSIKALLKENEIYFGTYKHQTIDLSIKNMQTTFKKINCSDGLKSSLNEQISAADAKKSDNCFNNNKQKGVER